MRSVILGACGRRLIKYTSFEVHKLDRCTTCASVEIELRCPLVRLQLSLRTTRLGSAHWGLLGLSSTYTRLSHPFRRSRCPSITWVVLLFWYCFCRHSPPAQHNGKHQSRPFSTKTTRSAPSRWAPVAIANKAGTTAFSLVPCVQCR